MNWSYDILPIAGGAIVGVAVMAFFPPLIIIVIPIALYLIFHDSSTVSKTKDIAQQVKQDYQEKQEVKRLARKIQIEQMKSFLGDDDKE